MKMNDRWFYDDVIGEDLDISWLGIMYNNIMYKSNASKEHD